MQGFPVHTLGDVSIEVLIIANMHVWLPCTNIWETLSWVYLRFKGVNQKSKKIKLLVFTHSACPYKNYGLKCSQMLQTLY